MNDHGKVAIVGAGHVGSTLAYTLVTAGAVREVVIIDTSQDRAEGEAMDIAHASSFYAPVKIRSGVLEDVAGAAITVVTAGVAQKEGESRVALLGRNFLIVREIVSRIAELNPEGIILMATNPVDALTYAAVRVSGLPSSRVFGSGTVLDTARLRSELAVHYDIDARNVHAYVIGEHGDSEVVAWSVADIANMQLHAYCQSAELACSLEDMLAIETRVRNAAYEIIRRKGATNFAIAAALTRIIQAVIRNERSVLTVSTLLKGQYGLQDVCLSLPAIIGKNGVEQIITVPLSDTERQRLHESSRSIRNALESGTAL
jgi:L-lactate dehydrogenase